MHKGVSHIGVVKCILIGEQSQQRLYEVHWQDGDIGHLSAEAAIAGWEPLLGFNQDPSLKRVATS